MADTIITTLGVLSAAGSTHPVRSASGGSHTVALRVAGTGAVSFAGALEGANDPAGPWTSVTTLNASGTDSAAASGSSSSDYAFWRVTASTLSGTGVTALVRVSTDPVAGGGGSSSNTSGAVFVPSARRLLDQIEQARNANARDLPTIPSHELAHGETTYHANAAALQTAFPAASNSGKAGYVGTSTSYQIYVSDGAAWAAKTDVIAYARTGVSTTGYTETSDMSSYGITNVGPDFGGIQLAGKHRFIGGLPGLVIGSCVTTYYQAKNGVVQEKHKGFLHVRTSDKRPLLRVISGPVKTVMKVKTLKGWQYVADASLGAAQTSGVTLNYAFQTASAGGLLPLMLDFSAMTSDVIEFAVQCGNSLALSRTGIRATHVYLPVPRPALRGAMLTDSMGEQGSNGNADGNNVNCYTDIVRDMMGDVDLLIASEPSTGFVSDGSINRTHLEKLAYLATLRQYADDLDFIILAHSVNDGQAETLRPKADEALAFIKTRWPNALVFFTGGTARAQPANQTFQATLCGTVKDAVAASGMKNVVYVPTMDSAAGLPITGSGTVGATVGDGNSDRIFNAGDLTHFNAAGHIFWAKSVWMPQFVSALRAFVSTANQSS